ncbi:hypothetical protein ACFFSH_05795 [Streptomyces filamentosus]|uniref:hypothetical protein n=1 Tax=Streptomyces filamentosus TaxID=67294 RepID=UPI001674ECEB|nr:hypothetical protein [Streptomyces filamentosus]
MSVKILVVRSGMVVRNSSDGVLEVDGWRLFRYDRFTRELGSLGEYEIEVTDEPRDFLPSSFDILLHRHMEAVSEFSVGVRERCILLESDPNSYLRMAGLKLLGAVTGDGFQSWWSEGSVLSERSFVGLRSVAEKMGAVGAPVMGGKGYCHVTRSDLKEVPAVLNEYIKSYLFV